MFPVPVQLAACGTEPVHALLCSHIFAGFAASCALFISGFGRELLFMPLLYKTQSV